MTRRRRAIDIADSYPYRTKQGWMPAAMRKRPTAALILMKRLGGAGHEILSVFPLNNFTGCNTHSGGEGSSLVLVHP